MTFEQVKKKVEELTEQKQRAIGVKESIEKKWEDKYGTSDVNDVKAKLEELKAKKERLQKDFDEKLLKANEMLEGK